MKIIARAINAALSHFNVALVRRSMLDALVAKDDTPRVQPELQRIDARQGDLLNWSQEQIRCQIAQKWSLVDAMHRQQRAHRDDRLSCPLCGHEDSVEKFAVFRSHCIFGGGDLLRQECPACNVVFGPNKMLQLTEAELSQDYEWHYRVFSEVDSTDRELRAFHALNPFKDGIYLNYGAGGWSRSVQQLRAEGWNVLAFEPHVSAAAQADYLICSHKDLQSMRFDGIFSNNVLEHLRYPVREMSQLTGLLKDGGRMSHATPCFEYLYEFTRFHLFFYLSKSREVLAHKAGLQITNYIVDGEFMCCVMERSVEPKLD